MLASYVTLTGSGALWGVVLALHLLGMAVWIGAAYAALVLRASLGLLDNTPRVNVLLQAYRRFIRLVWHVMPIVLVTGWLMTIFRAGGLLGAPWFVEAMQVLGLLMAAAFLAQALGPWRRLRRAVRPTEAQLAAVRTPVIVQLVLGALTVLVASLGHFPG